jgi:hypothetical protein
VTVIVDHVGAEDNLVDILSQRVAAVPALCYLADLLPGWCRCTRCGWATGTGGGDRIAVDVERRLLFCGQR